MGLLKLSVHNFKSYSGSIEIPLDAASFVAVVGPNGSGKSNLLDAICFIIGIDSSQLRASNSSELTSSSSTDKEMYVVALVTSDSRKIEFKRTASGYFIDGKAVEKPQYNDAWSELNVFPDARNCVIMQGDVEELAGAEASHLARLIEGMQASVSPREVQTAQQQYESLESEIKKLSEETRKHALSRRNAQADADEALEMSTAREKLTKLRSQLRKAEKRRKILVMREKEAVLAEMRRKNEEAQAKLEECRAEADMVDANSKKLRSDYARKRRQLLNARNQEVEAQEAFATAEAEFLPLEKKQEAIETEQRLLEPDLEYAKQLVSSAKEEVETAENAIKLLDKEDASEQNILAADVSPDIRDWWARLEDEFMKETALEQDKLDSLRKRTQMNDLKYRNQSQRMEDARTELATANSRVKQRELRVQQLKSMVEERTSQQDEYKRELEKVASDLQTLKSERKELRDKLHSLTEKIRASDGNKRGLAQRHRLLDGVERLKRSHKDKVYDLLGNLVTPVEDRFARALEKALGHNADAIVVSDSETAIECISQARKERLGNFSFLPLADLVTRDIVIARAQLAKSPIRDMENPRLALDCATFDPVFRPAVSYALGDTVFSSTFSAALSLRKLGLKMPIIDLNGSLITSNNIMSASPGEPSTTSSERSLAALQRKSQSIAEKLKADQRKEVELSDQEIRLSAQLDRASQMIEGAESELRMSEENLRSSQADAKFLQEKFDVEFSRLEELQNLAKNSQEELAVHSKTVEDLRKEKFGAFLEAVGETLTHWDDIFLKRSEHLKELTRHRQRLEDRLQLAKERYDVAMSQLSRQQQRADSLQSALEKLLRRKDAAAAELQTMRQKLDRCRGRVQSLRADIERKSDEVGAIEAAVEAAAAQVAQAEREQHQRALLLAAEVGEQKAADSDESDSDLSSEPTRSKPSRSKRKRQAEHVDDREVLSIDRLDAKIKDLKFQIEPLEKISAFIASDEESLERASQLRDSLDQNVVNSRSQLDNLVTKLSQLKEQRSANFNTTLNSLQSTLSEVYASLAGKDALAKLTPIDSDVPFEGVELMVMPPGKPFTHVSQLSGGERSMAALALLFSWQRLYPAPFVVLDEVDAALDFSNVARVAKYIEKYSKDCQFIIVSLKQRLFQTAGHLVGVYKGSSKSKILTVPMS